MLLPLTMQREQKIKMVNYCLYFCGAFNSQIDLFGSNRHSLSL